MPALLLAIACKLPASSPTDHPSHGGGSDTTTDADQDGYDATVDCNDADASVHPGTKETCGNGVDDNCNGAGDGCPWEGESALEGWELSGSEPDELFGSTLAVCDADGDGQDDLIVGSAGTNADAGAVHVFYGPFGEETAVPRVWTILGTGPSTTFGSALDCQSDMTGDDAADLLIGEPDETGKTAGAMYVVPGGDTGETPIADAYVSAWGGVFGGDRFGYGVLALGGANDDEIAVTALGGSGNDLTQYGVTYVVGSGPGTHSASTVYDYVFGTPDFSLVGAVGKAGDMNGDGIDELALAVTYEVLLYELAWSGALAADDFDLVIESPDAMLFPRWTQLGHADLNGDGYDDFLLGSPGNDNVLVFLGVLDAGTDLRPDAALIGRTASHAGKAIASPGDLDGDGKDELLIGAPDGGGVYLYRGGETVGSFGLDHGAAQASWWIGDTSDAGDTLGAGNLTDDAVSEFVVGVPHAGADAKGAVILIPSLDL